MNNTRLNDDQWTSVISLRPKQYLQPTMAQEVLHPLRPPKPTGLVYERYDKEFDRTVSFRAIDPIMDIAQFHAWQNDPRVAKFWEMNQSISELADYLEAQKDDAHVLGLIGSIDGEDFGYFEAYWCLEDRLGAYYDCQDYDRGWHGLTGSRKHLGKKNTLAWMKSLCHYLFLDDSRTARLMGEPRADNTLLLRCTEHIPYQNRGEFDFPHKRSALMQLDRDTFFNKVLL